MREPQLRLLLRKRVLVWNAANENGVERAAAMEAAAQMSAADVDDSSVWDRDDQAKQTDVQHSYEKYFCSSKRKCYDDPFPKD